MRVSLVSIESNDGRSRQQQIESSSKSRDTWFPVIKQLKGVSLLALLDRGGDGRVRVRIGTCQASDAR